MPLKIFIFISLMIAIATAESLAATGQESTQTASEIEAGPLSLVGIEITPVDPSAETLCTLTVHIENASERQAFSLAFEVEVGGQNLPVYEKQLFMVPVPPSGSNASADDGTPTNPTPFELDLFNFWTSDSRRAAPADGKLTVTVRLIGAQWLEISQEKDASSGGTVDVWTPKGPVPGLPQNISTTLKLAKP